MLLISHRKHRIHRLLFIIPFTLVFNSQNLQVASPLLPSGGKNNFVATKTITKTKTASGVIFFFEHKSHEFNESLRETKRKPFTKIHGQFMAIGVNINYQKLLVNYQK